MGCCGAGISARKPAGGIPRLRFYNFGMRNCNSTRGRCPGSLAEWHYK